MTSLEETLEYIHCARVAVKAGYNELALDFLKDAQAALERKPPILERPNVELCEALERELSQI